MTGEVIKSFLVGLGFDVDDSSFAKFNKAITSATIKVTALYGSIKLMSAAIFYSISKISEGFEQMGYEYRIIAPAINKAILLRNELLKAYRAAGLNIRQAVVESVKFNFALTKTKYAFEAIYKSVGVRFLPLLTKQMDIFRRQIYANMPKIQDRLEKFIKIVFQAFNATVILGTRVWSILERVYDFFAKLHDATDGWSTVILGVIAAWRLLNLAFIATPLGAILAGFVAILALYDDFKTFEEGGKSFFNWTAALPTINAIRGAVAALVGTFRSMVDVVLDLVLVFTDLFRKDWSSAWDHLKESAQSALNVFQGIWGTLKGIVEASGNLGQALHDKIFGVPAENLVTNLQNPTGGARAAPLGTNISNQRQTNVNVDQQTQIHVIGAADASATARATADQQSRVNFDLTRNLSTAVK